MDIKLKFNATAEMHSHSVILDLILLEKGKDDKWPKSRVIMTKKVPISNWFWTSNSFAFRVNSAKERMIRDFKNKRHMYLIIDRFLDVIKKEEYIVEDSKTTSLLKKLGINYNKE